MFGVVELRAEEMLSQLDKIAYLTRRDPVVAALGYAAAAQAGLEQDAPDLEGGLLRRTDQDHTRAHHLTNCARQVRVMGAPEQERINPGGGDGGK